VEISEGGIIIEVKFAYVYQDNTIYIWNIENPDNSLVT
jgi:hypothetical protein